MPVDPKATRRFIESLSTHLEDHLAAWKSSLADTRREIDDVLMKVGEKIPAQARPLFPEDLVALMLEDVLPPPTVSERVVEKVVERFVDRPVPSAAPAAPAPPDWSVARGSCSAIESARTQVDVLTRFLAQSHAHASRVALLVLRNDRMTGWKAVGYDTTGGNDEAIKGIDIGAQDDPFAAMVLSRERSMIAEPASESSVLRRALGGTPPSRTFIVPMVIRDRVAGLLIADELPGEEGRLNPAALEVLTFVTGLAVDLLAARKKIPSPSLTPTGEEIPRYEAGAPPMAQPGATVRAIPAVTAPPPSPPTPRPAPAARPAAPPVSAVDQEGPSVKRKITDAADALRALEESASARKKAEMAAAPPAPPPAPMRQPTPSDLGLTTAIPAALPEPAHKPAVPPPTAPGDLTFAFDQIKSAPLAPPPPAAPAPPAPPPAPKPAVPPPAPVAGSDVLAAGSGVTPMAPPAGFVPRGKAQRGDDQQRAQEDAKRLARLLVSEIKLYNEKKVEEGRAQGDLYQRLKDDIERSRQVYEERTPELIRRGTNYFQEEIVRILCDGRTDALGPMG